MKSKVSKEYTCLPSREAESRSPGEAVIAGAGPAVGLRVL